MQSNGLISGFLSKMVNLQIACVGNTFLGHVEGVSVGSALSHSVPMWTPPTPHFFRWQNFAGLTALCQHQKVQFCEIFDFIHFSIVSY